jgi:hypothetical protein
MVVANVSESLLARIEPEWLSDGQTQFAAAPGNNGLSNLGR